MANHLLIGLGGTGGKILREMRKRVYEEFESNSNTGNAHLEYIYVDSDEKDLKNDAEWNYMGVPVHLKASQKVNIHGIGGGVLDNLNAYPGIRAFVTNEDREAMKNDTVSAIIDAGIGGQRRRFGRILTANNVTNDPNNGFSAVLKGRIIDMTQKNEGDGIITFHICAGLAGGTGSGSIVDAVAQLHKIIEPMGHAFKVFLYLYVPEILVPSNENEQGFYHANGYAALQEINGLALGTYKPTDVSGEKDNRTGLVKRLISNLNANAFTRAYVFSDRNESNKVLRKKDKLPHAVADFLFQRIVMHEVGQSSQLGRVVEAENAGSAPEQNEEGQNVHARDFMTFGITRVEYPETEIKAYADKKTVSVQLQGLINNNWILHHGFALQTDEEAGMGLGNEVKQPATLESLMLSYEYLTLQNPVSSFAGTENWNSYDTYWTNYCDFFASDIIESERDRFLWVSRFEEIVEMEYGSNFRNLGVNNFFENQKGQREIQRYAAVICKHIESKLFNEWIVGQHGKKPMSLQKVQLFISELINATRERIPGVSEQRAALVSKRDNCFAEANRIKQRLQDTGWLSNLLFSTAKKLFLDYVGFMAQYYAMSTKIEACDFATLLLQEIVTRLTAINQSVLLLQNMCNETRNVALSSAEESCRVENEYNQGEVQFIEKRYDPNETRSEIEAVILSDEELQRGIQTSILQRFKQISEESEISLPFRAVYEALGGTKVKVDKEGHEETKILHTIVESISRPQIKQKLEQIGDADSAQKLLGVNILEKLKSECTTQLQLEAFVRGLKEKAQCFLQFNQAEVGRISGGQTPAIMHQAVQICLPEFNDPTNFRERFIEAFRGAFEGNIFNDHSIAVNSKANQIVVILLKADFPLRFVQNINHLNQVYNDLTSEHNPHGKLNKILLHTESLPDSVLPSLFEEDPIVLRERMALVALKLHSIPGLITVGKNPITGDPVNVVTVGRGLDAEDFVVGKDALETIEKLCIEPNLRKNLSVYVEQELASRYKSQREKEELCNIMEEMIIKIILPLCDNNRLHPTFIFIKDIFKGNRQVMMNN